MERRRGQHPINLALFVAPRSVNIAIGKKGALIAETEKSTQCTISFEKDDEVIHGSNVRVCRIGGPSIEHVLGAAHKVWESDDVFKEARLCVTDGLVPVIIGKNGAMIKEIQDHSDVQLSFCRSSDMGRLEGQVRQLTIKGDFSAIRAAMEKVLKIMADAPPPKKGSGGHGDLRGNSPRRRVERRDSGHKHHRDDHRHHRGEERHTRDERHHRGEERQHRDERHHRGEERRHNGHLVPSSISHPATTNLSSAGNQKDDDVVTAQFFVLPNLVPLAIGKGGSTIKQITNECGKPQISFETEDETIGELVFRRCTIKGSCRSVSYAAALLSKLDSSMEPQIILILPDTSVPIVIGGSGQMIKQITQYSKAFLSFATKEEMGSLAGVERSLVVKGAMDAVRAAISQVIQMNHNYVTRSGAGTENRGEKRPAGKYPDATRDTHHGDTRRAKKVKWDLEPDCDISIGLAAAHREAFPAEKAQEIENQFGVECVIREDDRDFVILIFGENSVPAQQEVQNILANAYGPIRWNIRSTEEPA